MITVDKFWKEKCANGRVGKEILESDNPDWFTRETIIEFARFHVQEALKEAYNKAELKEYQFSFDDQVCYCSNDMGDSYVLSRNSIINAYNLDNIK